MHVIVTGAAKGIGRSITTACRARDWAVTAVDIDAGALADAHGADDGIVCVHGSVHANDVGGVIGKLERHGGRYSALVNNVGISSQLHWDELTRPVLDRAMATNVVGPWILTQWWSERLITTRAPGSAVFITSLHTQHVRLFPDYSMTKAAVSMLLREAAIALAPHQIRVNGVQPGAINTWRPETTPPSARDLQSEALIPLGRLGRPHDVALAVVHLLDPEQSGYVTGTELRVDGGLQLHNWLCDLPPEGGPGTLT